MSLTPSRVQDLERCIKDGLSASQAGKRLGMTRNAVLGKAHRLGLQFRSDDGATAARVRAAQAKHTPAKPVVAASPKQPAEVRSVAPRALGIAGNGHVFEHGPAAELPRLREAPPSGDPVTMADPAFRGCRWPINDPGPGRMDETLFCNGPQKLGRDDCLLPYCKTHDALAYQPTVSANGKRRQTANELARSLRKYVA